ncbi:MAG: hypothetical protein U9N38_03165 [Thermodesulfobacteriota bacterium]|nr:hypothetical protein [Thermodesulfobacteriota bacterium]
MPAEIHETIRAIEGEAEKLIEKARMDTQAILEDANRKVREIISSEIPMNEIENDRDRIISSAEEEAKMEIEKSKETSRQIISGIAEKIDNFSQLMADQIRGFK